MADYRFTVAHKIIEEKYTFAVIGMSSIARMLLYYEYNAMVRECNIVPIEFNPEGFADAKELAKEFAPHLDEKETLKFCKCMVVLDYTFQQILDGREDI